MDRSRGTANQNILLNIQSSTLLWGCGSC
ncbi:hypothetical protein BDFB_011850 [Asbolus verrucosus]|uniref:Uncharacterized protein n=1 Tax=Asbolus verrucosus TaxID=1661398 RepID=A0A482W2F9_ASBVE|nr:hypothetical protein BDFB_011850 [Asbolus verrucosus]